MRVGAAGQAGRRLDEAELGTLSPGQGWYVQYTRGVGQNRGMPWTAKDADKHNKGLSPKQKRVWAQVANHTLAATQDDGRAIREANAAVKRMR